MKTKSSQIIWCLLPLLLGACRFDARSLFGGNTEQPTVQSGETAKTPTPTPVPAEPKPEPTPPPSGGCTYVTLDGYNPVPNDTTCLHPGGPTNWLAQALVGKNLPGGEAADGPVIRLVFRFLGDGSAPSLLNDEISLRTKIGLAGRLKCSAVTPEFSWQAKVYDCRFDGMTTFDEYVITELTVVNSKCGAKTKLQLESRCSHSVSAKPGYPIMFLGHGILISPLRKK